VKPGFNIAKNPRGHLVFAVLASLILVIVSGSLFFTSKIMNIFKESVEVHEGRMDNVRELDFLFTYSEQINVAGQRLFRSDDVDGARAEQETALATFNNQFAIVRESTSRESMTHAVSSFPDYLDRIKYSVEQVARDQETVFRLFEAGEPGLASRLMSATSRHQETLEELILGAIQLAQNDMQKNLDLQIENADIFLKYTYIIVSVLAVFLGLLTLYGRKIYMDLLRSGEAHGKAVEATGAALAELAGHTRALNEHAIVAVTDTKGTITYANDRFCEISKYSKEELVGSNHRIVGSGHHPPSFFAEMYRAIANGQTWQGEMKNRAKDGSYYWVYTTITPLRDADGKINRYAAIRTDITDRKEAEKILQAKESILKTTFDNFPGAISVIDADLALVAVNDTFFELLNLPRELFRPDSTLEDIIRFNAERGEYGEGDVDELVRDRIELAKKFEAHSFERTRPDGVTIKVSGIPLPNGGFVTTYLDVTEDRRNIEAVRAAKDRYQRLMETTNVVPWEYNIADRRFNYVGPQTEYLLGYLADDWYDEDFWLTSMHADDREEVLKFCIEANKRLEDYNVEYRMLTREGEPVWVHNYISVSAEDNKPVSLNGVIVDITERKKTEQELTRQASLRDLLSAVSVAANNVMDADTILYFCLRRICEFTGWSLGHVYNPARDGSGMLQSTQFTYVDDPEQFVEFVETTEKMKFRPGEGLPGRVLRNGSLDWIANIAEDVNMPRSQACRQCGLKGGVAVPVVIDKEIVSILEFFSKREMEPSSDEIEMLNFVAQQVGRVIERSRAEQELTEHRDHLQEMVELSTLELEKKAKDLAEALDKEKHLNELQRQFVSMTSHEFRTPLTIIDSAAQRMKRRVEKGGLSPEDAVERIDNIRSAVRRMIRLMESTLSAARMDEGKIGIKIGPCDLQDVIGRVCASQSEVSDTHNINLNLVEFPTTIKADPDSLEQVFTNLISNAVKYTPDDPDIVVTGYVENDQVVVTVSDNGLGIDAEDLDRVGERFFRAKTSTGIAGTGIGLNLVKALVLQHGGSLNVESVKGEGSTFIVRLPIDGPDPQESMSSETVGDAAAA
jgi:PAS domain S-box-containing protein